MCLVTLSPPPSPSLIPCHLNLALSASGGHSPTHFLLLLLACRTCTCLWSFVPAFRRVRCLECRLHSLKSSFCLPSPPPPSTQTCRFIAALTAGDAGLSFVEGNAEALPFPDASFDAYTIAFGIRNVMDRGAALREARRVLKHGGR